MPCLARWTFSNLDGAINDMKRVLVSWMFIRFLILIPFKMHAAGKIFILKMTATGYQRTYLVSVLSLILLSFCSFCTASEVTDVFPPGGSHSAAVDTDLSVILDAMVDPGTVDSSTFVVHGGFHAPVTGSFNIITDTFTFDATDDFHPGELIQATVTNGIESGGEPVNPYVWWFRTEVKNGVGTFEYSDQALGIYSSFASASGDLDGDGDLDAFVVCLSTDLVYLNDGNGHFTNSGQMLADTCGLDVSLGDLDGDGDLDALVVTDKQGNRVWLNDGSGTFIDSGQYLGTSYSTGVSLGDVDADGDLDAIIAIVCDGNKVWINDGYGIFTDSGQSLGDFCSVDVFLGDLDADGDLDAFVVNYDDSNRVWLNDGSGTFIDSGQDMGNSHSRGVSLGDVDADGDLDAFIANSVWEDNRVSLNDGAGVFSDSGQSLGSHSSWDVSLGDLDGDGDLDAFVANWGSGNRVWLNDGSGTFTTNGQSLGKFDSGGVSLGNMDGDGDLDAFVSNYVHDDSVWLNQILPTPTPTPVCTDLGCTITMPLTEYSPGDVCFVDVTICNPDAATYLDVPVFVILDVYGTYFFAPSFSDYNHYNMDVAPGETIINVLPEFIWPNNSGSASDMFWYAGMTNSEMNALFGAMDTFEFGWTE